MRKINLLESNIANLVHLRGIETFEDLLIAEKKLLVEHAMHNPEFDDFEVLFESVKIKNIIINYFNGLIDKYELATEIEENVLEEYGKLIEPLIIKEHVLQYGCEEKLNFEKYKNNDSYDDIGKDRRALSENMPTRQIY